MDLDDELRRMFANADERLDVAVRPDAEQLIVAGARRVRRRRIAAVTTGGALALVALVGGGIALAGHGPQAMPPAANQTETRTAAPTSGTATSPSVGTTTAIPPVTQPPQSTTKSIEQPPPSNDAPPPVVGEQIGPMGWRGLRLGMSYDDALAAGLIDPGEPPTDAGCVSYPLLLDGEPAGEALISTNGVRVINPAPTLAVHTPEGASYGWTVEQVRAVYPDLGEQENTLVVAPGNREAGYRLEFAGGQLADINLQIAVDACPA